MAATMNQNTMGITSSSGTHLPSTSGRCLRRGSARSGGNAILDEGAGCQQAPADSGAGSDGRTVKGAACRASGMGPPSHRLRCHPLWMTLRRAARRRSQARTSTPVLPWSSISSACLDAHLAQRRHRATSGWLPRWTIRAESSTVPQHQHRDRSANASSTAACVAMHLILRQPGRARSPGPTDLSPLRRPSHRRSSAPTRRTGTPSDNEEGARPVGRAPSSCSVDQMTPVTYFRFLYVVVGGVLEDADGGLGRATGVAHVDGTGDTLVVDVLALLQQGGAVLEAGALRAVLGDLDDVRGERRRVVGLGLDRRQRA